MSRAEPLFQTEALQFLRDLEANNGREWFQPRKQQYEDLLKTPMVKAVECVNAALSQSAPDYVTEPAKAVYRVYRDTRFSKDKTPYKTHIGALLWHRLLGKNGGAALYFHVSANEFLVAAGLYKAPPEILLPVRKHIAAHHQMLRSILRAKKVREYFGNLQGEKLNRPPKGWSADDPAIDFLVQKDLLLERSLPPETACAGNLRDELTKRLLAAVPFVDFLNQALLAERQRAAADPLLGGWAPSGR